MTQSPQRSPPSGLLSPSPEALHASMEPLQLQGGWLRKLTGGHETPPSSGSGGGGSGPNSRDSSPNRSSARNMFARLTLGLSPSHPAVLSCFDGEAANSARLMHLPIDSSLQLSSDSEQRQLALHSRPAGGADAVVGVHHTFQAPNAREFRAWAEAFEQVAAQTRSWEEDARRARERLHRLAVAAATHPPPVPPSRAAKPPVAQPMALPVAKPVTQPIERPATAPAQSQQQQQPAPSAAAPIAASHPSVDPPAPSSSELAVEMQSLPIGGIRPSAPLVLDSASPPPLVSSRSVRTVSDAHELGASEGGDTARSLTAAFDGARLSVPSSRNSSNADAASGFNPESCQPISAVSPQLSAHPSPAWQRRSMPTLPLPSPAQALSPSSAADEAEESREDRAALPAVASLLAEAEKNATEAGDSELRVATHLPVDADLVPSTPSERSAFESTAASSSWESNGAGGSNACTPVSRSGTVLKALQAASAKPAQVDVQPSTLDSEEKLDSERKQSPDPSQHVTTAASASAAPSSIDAVGAATFPALMAESSPLSGGEGPMSPASRERKQRQGDYAGFGSGGRVTSGSGSGSDYSGISHVSVSFDLVASSTRSANATVPLSPTSVLRSASPAVPPSHGQGLGQGQGQAHALRSSMSADFTGSGGLGLGANGASASAASPRSAYEVAAAAAAVAAASARESARIKAVEKETARLKALEKKAQDARALREMKSRMFTKLFSLPESEALIEDYSAAIRRSILLHGRLYISWHHLCFFSNIFSHKTSVVLPMTEVLWVSAASVALLFDNSIKVYVQTGPLPVPKINAQGHVVPLPGATIVVPAALPPAVAAAVAEPRSTPGASSPAQQGGASSSPSLSSTAPTRADLPQLLEEAAAEAAEAAQQQQQQHSPVSSASASSVSESAILPCLSLSSSFSADPASAEPSPADGAGSGGDEEPLPAIVAEGTGESYSESIPTTDRATLDLNEQQLAYLIAIGHANIATHFFASFLMRDHCLALIEGILRKRRELNPHWARMDRAWKGIDARRAREQARVAEEAAASAAAAAAAAAAKEAEAASAAAALEADAEHSANGSAVRDPPLSSRGSEAPSPFPSLLRPGSAASVDSHSHSVNESATHASTRSSSVSSVASAGGAVLSSAASSPRNGFFSPLGDTSEQKSSALSAAGASAPSTAVAAASGGSDSSSRAALSTAPPLSVTPRLDFGDAKIPDDDFGRMEWDELVDRPLVGLNARLFFSLFLSDAALWSTMQYALSAGRGDDKWKLSSWHRLDNNEPVMAHLASGPGAASPTNKIGPWVRDSSYIKIMKDSPVGPPSTRVHQHSIYSGGDGVVKIETRSLTPDVPFGDNLYVLERLTIEDEKPTGAHAEGFTPRCRVRVHVGVRFIRTPWKMKMFVALIKSRTKEDVAKWYDQWIDSVELFMKRNTAAVRAAIVREMGPGADVALLQGDEGARTAAPRRGEGAEGSAAAAGAGQTGSAQPSVLENQSVASASAAAGGLPALSLSAISASSSASSSSSPSPICPSCHNPSPSAPKPLIQRLREGGGAALRSVPVLGPHADTVMASVSDAHTRLSTLSMLELLGVALVIAAIEALLVQGRQGADALLSMLLPWRWIGALLSATPAALLCGALLCLLLHQRQQLADMTQQLQRTEQQHGQLHRNVQEQLSSLTHLVQQMAGRSTTTRIDERHFR